MTADTATPRTPKRRLDCDVMSLPLSPEEAFLLSRIDDQVNEAELALLAGLDISLVQPALQRLAELGAIRLESVTRRPPAGEMTAVVTEAFAGVRLQPPVADAVEAPTGPYPISELEELCDLGVDEKRKILDLYYRLDELTHYALLRVPRSADKRAIKRAYYELAPNFHPDRHFRKDLGSFKPKMETIFGRLTLAHDTLTREADRAAYDAQLGPPQPKPSAPPPASRSGAFRAAKLSPSNPPAPPLSAAEEERVRRAALARKLLGHAHSQPPNQTAAPPAPDALTSADVALETLRNRRTAIQDATQRTLLKRYLESAEASKARGDLASAANFFRLARELAPNDVAIADAQEQMARAAAGALAQSHLDQGDAEAKKEHWQDAAHSYSKAANGLPKLMEAQLKAANAWLRAGDDVRKAVDFARRAVALEPRNFDARYTLAEAYIQAGLKVAAQKEVDAMREIDAMDARLASLNRRLK